MNELTNSISSPVLRSKHHAYHLQVQPQSASPDHLIQDATAIAAHYLDDTSPLGVSVGGMSGHGDPTPLWVRNAAPHQTASPSIRIGSPPTAAKPAEPSPKPRKKAAAKVRNTVLLKSLLSTTSMSFYYGNLQLTLGMNSLHHCTCVMGY